MTLQSSEVDRLDMAARAFTGQRYISRNRGLFLIVIFLLVLTAIAYHGKFESPLIAPIFVAFALTASAALWINWRFKIYVLAIFCFLIALGAGVMGKSFPDRTDQIYMIAMSAIIGINLWKMAGPYATANAPGWESERFLVEDWWQKLTALRTTKDIIEFSAGGFWTGYHTYRLLSEESCWATLRYWRGMARVTPVFRVRQLSAISFAELPSGEKRVTLGSRTMRATNLKMPERENYSETTFSKGA